MTALQKTMFLIMSFGVAMGLSILVMIYGWGLEIRSWWWIIGGGIFLRILLETMTSITKGK